MDLRPLLRPRHLTITVLVGLLAGATIAAATVGTEPDVPSGLGAPVAFPTPAVGDRGTYDIWMKDPGDGDDPATWGEPDRTFRFEWGADELRLDGNGQVVWANLLRTFETYDDSDGNLVYRNDTRYLYAGTDLYFESTGAQADQFVQEGGGFTPTATVTTDMSGNYSFYRQDHLWESNPCVRHPLQGARLALSDASIAGLDCWWGADAPRVRVDSVGGQPGSRDVLLVARATGAFQLPEAVGRLWLREGIAYPIRIEEVWQNKATEVAVLRDFDAGTVAVRGETPSVDSLPPLEWAPRQQWGFDEGGLEHPFPLSQAFAVARAAPESGLPNFLADHPDGYVAWGTFAEFDMAERMDFRWSFGVADGAENVSVEVILRQTKPVLGVPVPGMPPETEYIFSTDPQPNPQLTPLPKDQVPATLPTLASLFARWQAHADTTEPGNSWSFQIGADTDGQGGSPGIYAMAGIVSYSQVTDAPAIPGVVPGIGPGTSTWRTSHITLYDDFDAVLMYAESTSASRSEEVPLPASAVPGGPSAPAAAAPSTPTAVEARGLFELTPLEQAGIGLGALAMAGLYWFAPAVKNGVAGLFSRIRDDDLLENPSRRMLRDLVEQSPGIHHQELVRRLGKGKGGAEHHLRKLVEGGVLVSKSSPGYTCYWVAGQATRASVAAAPVLKSPVAQGILRLRQQVPGMSNADLARALGVRPATIHYHLERMTAAGVLIQGQVAPGTAVDGSATAAA